MKKPKIAKTRPKPAPKSSQTTQKSLSQGKTVKIHLFGKSKAQLLKEIRRRLEKGQATTVVTPNPEFVVYAYKSLSFRKIINTATFAIPDGSYLFWAWELENRRRRAAGYQNWPFLVRFFFSSYQGFKISCRLHCGNLAAKRITGTDLALDLLRLAAQKKGYVFFLGAGPGIAAQAARRLQKKVSGWKLAGTYSGNGRPAGDRATRQAVLASSKPIFLLLVAYGMGKQERWLQRNLPYLSVKIAIGVGGAFDYYAGVVPRAPAWMRRHGLEWLYRLIRQPWRFRRQLKLFQFLWLVLSEKVSLVFD